MFRRLRPCLMLQLHSTPTPNPFCFTFHIPSQTYENFIPDGQTCEVSHRGLAWVHPLSNGMFEQYGSEIVSVFIAPRSLSITVYQHIEWDKVEWSISSFIGHYLVFNNTCVPPAKEYALLEDDLETRENDSEVLQCIKELLREQIRPMVQRDGGDVKLLNFNPETGVVSLAMLGACRTCPSSRNTLKDGIERVMKHFLPEVKEVVEAKGHAFYEKYELLFNSEASLRREAARIDIIRRQNIHSKLTPSLLSYEALHEPDGDE
ncbi:NIF system FeS cluster assembly [Trypanosoma melophagium]|uniref:NIF system FeS cluster assembly n=1 Tax=Trypanosoma melophagium TaxID=715481 RepID=UPI003519DB9D|nr:NIF system FeS cluster assembly [Trypanosoma melophagium]